MTELCMSNGQGLTQGWIHVCRGWVGWALDFPLPNYGWNVAHHWRGAAHRQVGTAGDKANINLFKSYLLNKI